MIAGNDVQLAGFKSLGRAFSLPLHGPKVHLQAVLFEKTAFFHHLPKWHVTRRAGINPDFFLSSHNYSYPFVTKDGSSRSTAPLRSSRSTPLLNPPPRRGAGED